MLPLSPLPGLHEKREMLRAAQGRGGKYPRPCTIFAHLRVKAKIPGRKKIIPLVTLAVEGSLGAHGFISDQKHVLEP